MSKAPDERRKRFCGLLVKFRKDTGLSQEVVAERLNRRQAYISKCETGMRQMSFFEFLEMAEAVGYDPCDFIEELNSSKSLSLPTRKREAQRAKNKKAKKT